MPKRGGMSIRAPELFLPQAYMQPMDGSVEQMPIAQAPMMPAWFNPPAPVVEEPCPPYPITCTQSMSPASVACRERAARCERQRPILGRPSVIPTRPAPVPAPRPNPFRPSPPVKEEPCPPYPITCTQSMSAESVACRARAAKCAKERVRFLPRSARNELVQRTLQGSGKKKGKCGKTRRQGCECSDDEMELEGGFIGALARGIGSLVSRVAPRVASTAARSGTTAARTSAAAARSTAIVPYSAATAARNAAAAARASSAAASGATAASRLGALGSRLAPLGRALGTTGKLASFGLPIGLSIYQAVDYEQQKAQQERDAAEQAIQDRITEEENAKLIADQKKILETEQQRATEEYNSLVAQRKRDEEEYAKLVAQQEAEYERQLAQAEREAALIEEQYRQQMEQNRLIMEAQIAAQAAEIARRFQAPRVPPTQPAAPPRPPTQPTQPTAPSRPAVPPAQQPYYPPQQAPAPSTGRRTTRGSGAAGAKRDGRSARAAVVRRVMQEKKMSLPQASRYVKENNLY